MKPATESTMTDGQSHLVIPKWFLTMSSVALTLATITFVPWVVWTTRATMRLEVKMEAIDGVTMKIDLIQQEQLRRAENTYRLTTLQNEVDRIQVDITEIRSRLNLP